MSHPDNSPENASERILRRPGRIRTLFAVLAGAPVVPEQIRAEWAAWQLELEAICDKIGAAAARLQTRNKRELDRALAELAELKAERESDPAGIFGGDAGAGGGYSPMKRALNRRRLGLTANGAAHVPSDQAE